ncbi:MAG: hypothetical protein H6584_07235 [Flavobacteriales bacterium]|nr:hypothetical protein [Flavobacteriales bacterium]
MTESIAILEKNIQKLIQKLAQLEHENKMLKEQINSTDQKVSNQKSEMENLKIEMESLRLANALLGSDENKRETKLKINLLIREIDYCIAELSE